jgi:hypothetical protein
MMDASYRPHCWQIPYKQGDTLFIRVSCGPFADGVQGTS